MKKIPICIIAIIIILSLTGCGIKQVRMPFDSSDTKNMQYTDVVQQLKDAGFENVEAEPVVTEQEDKDSLVKNIDIYVTDNYPAHSFKENQTYAYNKRIVVTFYVYETPSEDEAVETSPEPIETVEESSEQSSESSSEDVFVPEKLDVTDEEYLELVKKEIDGCIGSFEKYGDITLKDKILTISVKMGADSDYEYLSAEDVAESRISDITDALLILDDSYWDKVILDFGNVGIYTGTKNDIESTSYGRYFYPPFLDKNKEKYEEESSSSETEPLTSLQIEYAKAIAKRECDYYLSGVTYPKSGYYVGRFDDNGAIYVYTDQVELKTKDEKQAMFLVFTPQADDFDLLTNITVHYLSVGNKVYTDDGYSDNFFSQLSNMGN